MHCGHAKVAYLRAARHKAAGSVVSRTKRDQISKYKDNTKIPTLCKLRLKISNSLMTMTLHCQKKPRGTIPPDSNQYLSEFVNALFTS